MKETCNAFFRQNLQRRKEQTNETFIITDYRRMERQKAQETLLVLHLTLYHLLWTKEEKGQS